MWFYNVDEEDDGGNNGDDDDGGDGGSNGEDDGDGVNGLIMVMTMIFIVLLTVSKASQSLPHQSKQYFNSVLKRLPSKNPTLQRCWFMQNRWGHLINNITATILMMKLSFPAFGGPFPLSFRFM